MTGSTTGATGGSAGVTKTNESPSSTSGAGVNATFDYVVSQALGKIKVTDIIADVTTNTTIAGAASYANVASTSNASGTGVLLDVTVAGTTAPTVTAVTADASNVGSGYVAGEILTIAAGALGTGQLINAQNITYITDTRDS